jgi:hypothetical protein
MQHFQNPPPLEADSLISSPTSDQNSRPKANRRPEVSETGFKIVYKITYPNGKIYVGQDRTDNINYFGSAQSRLIARDFTREERANFSVTRQVLWESVDASNDLVSRMEVEFILKLRANDPAVGYNMWPKLRTEKVHVGESSPSA